MSKPRPEHVPNLAMGVADHVRFVDELHAEQLGQCGRIDGSGVDLGRAVGLEIPGMAEPEVNALRHEEIPEPVPYAGAPDDGLMRSWQRGEVGGDGVALRWEVGRADERVGGTQGVDGEGALVQVNAGVQHPRNSQSRGSRTSLRSASLEISKCCNRQGYCGSALRAHLLKTLRLNTNVS